MQYFYCDFNSCTAVKDLIFLVVAVFPGVILSNIILLNVSTLCVEAGMFYQ